MSSRQGNTRRTNPIARRCLEILDQMTGQLLAGRKWGAGDQERLERIKSDLTKLVHWALHDHGDPDIVGRIRDCYRRCAVNLDDTTVLRQVRGVVKGELRKAGVDTAVPGLDPALDAATIILTTKRTIQRMGGVSSSSSTPSPALDRKTESIAAAASAAAPAAPPPAIDEPPPAKPHTVRTQRPPITSKRRPATAAEMQAAFDMVVKQSLAQIQRNGRHIEKADYLAAIYNDDAKKLRFLEQIADAIPPTPPTTLGQVVDGFFRNAFKGSYIERTDRQGNRRAHKR